MKKIRPKKCGHCKVKFQPARPFQPCCSVPCAIELMKAANKKQTRKADKVTRDRLKTRGMWLKEAQAAFNKFIRLRDEGNLCISCQKPPKKKNAGHFRPTKELRFNEDNCHLQCEHCNTYQHNDHPEHLSQHGLRHNIAITNGRQSRDGPPHGMRNARKIIWLSVMLNGINNG